ncbi:TonB-dependent receptor [Methylobacterium nodulans]|uniref:TonB-dependent receptor n=1 Tax=Methylobacterium nodulans (strain LMG 21967 / CNCM I-2342 / ORS 2060) TaxID=460265 RepID=B8IJ70_METNO|nr:TonB-dependent receptor [Methylobacterium nodulans]ACL56085.1 TonB-dependent receptor [Methylobacterium nodulans ORS 2060]
MSARGSVFEAGSNAALGVSLAASLGSFASGAAAQEADTVELSTIDIAGIRAVGQANTLNESTGLSRLPGRVQDTPQAITVVPGEVIRQQQATTLEQALRNVPGITVSAGEGNGGLNGDQFRIRGFQAKNDIYLDGLRDFGVYVRDSFNISDVVVIKGPSSETFGLGTVGGAINIVSKRASLADFTEVEGAFGSGPLGRSTLDVNRRIDETTAVRLNAMVHRQDVADRDNIKSDRWGAAASLGFGLGTDTTWFLNYAHQYTDRTPDFGVPTILLPGTSRAVPATELGLRRSTAYARASDMDRANADLLTSLMKWQVNDWLTVTNDSRIAFYTRDFSSTAPVCRTSSCVLGFLQGGNPFVGYSAGGGLSFLQDAWGAQNVTTAVARFETGALRHEVVAGIDYFYQADERQGLTITRPNQQIRTPLFDNAGFSFARNPLGRRESTGSNIGVFGSDRIWFAPQLSILAGIRYDDYTARYRTSAAAAGVPAGEFGAWRESRTGFASPKVALILEPNKDVTVYASWSHATTPAGAFVTQSTNIELPSSIVSQKPERTNLYEVGTKMSFLDGRLGFSAAAFRVEKTNSIDVDPVTGALILGSLDAYDARLVNGFELGLTGSLTEHWHVQFGYTHLDGRITASGDPVIGNRTPFTPENAVSAFTTYNLAPALQLPGRFLIGGGVFWDDGYFPGADNITRIPGSFSLDGLISYEHDGYRVAVNVYNLTDALNYGAAFSSRAVPLSGRTVLVSLGTRF